MSKVIPTLGQLADAGEFEQICRQTIGEMFGENKGDWQASYKLPHGVYDRTWPTGNYFSQFSRRLSDALIKEIKPLVSNKVKKFDINITKLNEQVVDLKDVWLIVEKLIANEIEAQTELGNNDIPGLEKGVNEGVIHIAGGKKTVPETTGDDRDTARKQYREKLSKINDKMIFLMKFRENLFQHFKIKFGIFKESESETRLGRK